jgi:hypothetical protein
LLAVKIKDVFKKNNRYLIKNLHSDSQNKGIANSNFNSKRPNYNNFTPLKAIHKNILASKHEFIISMDVETMEYEHTEIINNKIFIIKNQIPVLITCSYKHNSQIESFYTLINKTLLPDINLAILDL